MKLEVPFVIEGSTDEPYARALIEAVGAFPGTAYPARGKPGLLARAQNYSEAARQRPWLVLVDLDGDFPCPGAAVQAWVARPTPFLVFRVVTQAMEAWALGDREAAASFFSLPVSEIPTQPESVDNPKRLLVDLCRRSRKRAIRREMVPSPSSGRSQGAGYAARLIEYGEQHWRIDVARAQCPSLDRAVLRLSEKIKAFQPKA